MPHHIEFEKWATSSDDGIPHFMQKYNADPWWKTHSCAPLPYYYSITLDFNSDDRSWDQRWQSMLIDLEAWAETVGDLGRWSYAPPTITGRAGLTFFFDDENVAAAFKLLVSF